MYIQLDYKSNNDSRELIGQKLIYFILKGKCFDTVAYLGHI